MSNQQEELPAVHKQVLSVLPDGQENAIPFKEVLQRIGSRDERGIREVLSNLVTVYKQRVGSTSVGEKKGFYKITKLDDYVFADRALMTREMRMHERRTSLYESCKDMFVIDEIEEIQPFI